nr:DNA polymerase epsilon subunit 2 [Helicoverpa armigera]
MGDLQRMRSEITSTFKLSGFTLRKDASVYLAEQLLQLPPAERSKMLEKLAAHLLHQCISQPILEKDHIEIAYKECSTAGLEEHETILNVIDAFSIPKLCYNHELKKFVKDIDTSKCLLPDPKWKSRFVIDRYTVIWQRTLRNNLFTADPVNSSESEKRFRLRKVEFLLSCSSRVDDVVVLGLLTQVIERKYHLEDPTGTILLDMTDVRYHSGLFMEGSFVLAEGYYDDKVLHVTGLVQPPVEPREASAPYFGNLNVFGGKSKTSLKNSKALLKIEQENRDGVIVFVSDVWLDSPKVMDSLKKLFAGFEDYPPIAIVLIGEFLSCPYTYKFHMHLKNGLNSLADTICQFKQLKEKCKFIFVPGKTDPAAANVLPRPPLPNYLTETIQKKLGDNAIFTTNPCRIQYCTQEIVVFRHDLVMKLCRNTLHFPDSGDIPDHLTKTLLSQCCLTPLSIGVQPVFWKHSSALNLYPLPDLVIIADHFQPFVRNYKDCQVVNPGSFPRTEFTFNVYVPATRVVEESQIPNDDDI